MSFLLITCNWLIQSYQRKLSYFLIFSFFLVLQDIQEQPKVKTSSVSSISPFDDNVTVKFRKMKVINAREDDDCLVQVTLEDELESTDVRKAFFHVTGMSCSSCVRKIETELKKKPGISLVRKVVSLSASLYI